MARIRSIKPSFWKSRAVRRLNDREKLVWIASWNFSDDEGRLIDEPDLLAGEMWALGLSGRQIDTTLTALHEKGRLTRYSVDGEAYIQVQGWEHQRISNPTISEIPTESIANDSRIGTRSLRLEGKGGERKGGETPPTPYCVKHPGGTDKPCRACGDARRAFEAWQIAEKKKPTPKTTMPRPSECNHPKNRVQDGYCQRCGGKV